MLPRRFRLPRSLKCQSAAARLLGLWVRIPPGAWSVCCECCVLSCRGLFVQRSPPECDREASYGEAMTRNTVEAPQEGEEEEEEDMSPNDMPVQAERGGGGIAPNHSQPGTRTWVISTTFWPLYLQERPSTHCTRGWLGFGAGLNNTVNLDRGSIPRLSSPSGSLSRLRCARRHQNIQLFQLQNYGTAKAMLQAGRPTYRKGRKIFSPIQRSDRHKDTHSYPLNAGYSLHDQ